jgi:hypothetical protein
MCVRARAACVHTPAQPLAVETANIHSSNHSKYNIKCIIAHDKTMQGQVA